MILADTGFFIALLDQKDRNHTAAVGALQGITEPLITTGPIVSETSYMVLERYGFMVLVRFLTEIQRGLAIIFDIKAEHLERIVKIITKYRDLPADYADASLVLLADEIQEGRILSTDVRDFGAFRWKNHKPFKNLMVE